MLTQLDTLLRHLFMTQVGGITTEDQVRFQPPDQMWRTYVNGLGARNALNIYLFDLRENRKLRSNERVRSTDSGVAFDTPAAPRVDCHYLITAWSPMTVTPLLEPVLDEHSLLYSVTTALMAEAPLNPTRRYAAGSADLLAWPEGWRDTDLPTVILPIEAFPKYAEFWGTMGQTHPWKPAIYLVVTLPVVLAAQRAGYLVTTRETAYGRADTAAASDALLQIGGTVRAAGNQAVAAAWVGLEAADGATLLQVAETDAQGRFTFSHVRGGHYWLRVRAAGRSEGHLPIGVPGPAGGYDVQLA